MPPRGKIERDADGAPDRLDQRRQPDHQRRCSTSCRCRPSSESVEGTAQFFRELNRLGLTGVSDPGGYNLTRGELPAAVQGVAGPPRSPCASIYSLFAQRRGKELEDYQSLTQLLPMGFGDDMLRFNGIGENVTWGMYNNDNPTEAQKEQYYEVARWAAARGMTLTQHWSNNASVHHLLDVLERVNRETPIAPLRWSIAHLNDASEDNLRAHEGARASAG